MSIMQRLGAHGAELRLTAVVLCNVFIGLLTQVVILRKLGMSEDTDALVASQAVPAVILAVLGTALAKQLIPFFKEHGRDSGVLMPVLLYAGGATFLLVVLLFALEGWWLSWLFSGLAARGMQQVLVLSDMALLALLPGVCILILTGYWQSRHHFLRVELIALVSSLVSFTALIPAISMAGVSGVAAVLLMRALLQFLMLLWHCGDYRFAALSMEAKNMLVQGLRPALSAATIFKLGPLVDRALAAYAGSGAIALLNFLQQVYGVMLTVADRVLSPRIIAQVADARSVDARVNMLVGRRRIFLLLTVAAAVAGIIMVFVLPALLQLFVQEHLALDLRVLAAIFAVFLVAGVIGLQSASFMYGANLSTVVFRIALAGFAASILVRFAGMWFFGFYGLVCGIALYQVLNAVFLSRYLWKKFILEARAE